MMNGRLPMPHAFTKPSTAAEVKVVCARGSACHPTSTWQFAGSSSVADRIALQASQRSRSNCASVNFCVSANSILNFPEIPTPASLNLFGAVGWLGILLEGDGTRFGSILDTTVAAPSVWQAARPVRQRYPSGRYPSSRGTRRMSPSPHR